jgi:hypothetical protein
MATFKKAKAIKINKRSIAKKNRLYRTGSRL